LSSDLLFKRYVKAYLICFITLERSKTRQDKFESILEIIESVVSSPFVKAEADLLEYFVLRRENLFKKKYSRFQCTRKIAQYFRFAEKSGDNHPKHFRKLIM
jgi:hypothetical protein